MRLRADWQLILSYLVLIAGVTLAVSAGAESSVRGFLLGSLEEELSRELTLARTRIEETPEVAYDSIADALGSLMGRRLTIVTSAGLVIGESEQIVSDPPAGDDYRLRPEIRAALAGGTGRAIRPDVDTGADHLYLAVAARTGDVVRIAAPLVDIDAVVINLQRRIALAGLLAVPLAILFSYGFSVLITRPLRLTVEVARALGAGDLSRRVPVRRNDELGDLGSALNTLADELQRRLGQLEGERAETQALIDAMSEGVLALSASGTLRRANPAARRMFALGARPEGVPPEMVSRRPEFLGMVSRALSGQTVPAAELTGDGRSLIATAHPLPQGGAVLVFLEITELRRLEGVRRDFVANASHELKTPLTAIRGYSETLLDPDLPPELARQFAGIVKRNSDRLQRLVDDLLDLSRLEAGAWRVDAATVSIDAAARDAWFAETSSIEKPVDLVLDISGGRESVCADPSAVMQIFGNLFSNALRYTPVGGTVTVRSRDPGRRPRRPAHALPAPTPKGKVWTLIEVSDTGAGIPSTHLSRIFERFYRADPARSREEGGTGLGLAIVKHLVEVHGGWVEAESLIGGGTTIRFTLPAATDDVESSSS